MKKKESKAKSPEFSIEDNFISYSEPAKDLVFDWISRVGFKRVSDKELQCGIVHLREDCPHTLSFYLIIQGVLGCAVIKQISKIDLTGSSLPEDSAIKMIKLIQENLTEICPLFMTEM